MLIATFYAGGWEGGEVFHGNQHLVNNQRSVLLVSLILVQPI